MEENRQVCMERVLRVLEYDFLSEDELIEDPRLVSFFSGCAETHQRCSCSVNNTYNSVC